MDPPHPLPLLSPTHTLCKMGWANTWKCPQCRTLTHDGAPQTDRLLESWMEKREGWIGMESVLFGTSSEPFWPLRTTDIKHQLCWRSTEIKFIKKKVRWRLCLSLWKTSFLLDRIRRTGRIWKAQAFFLCIFSSFPSFLHSLACLYFLYLLITHIT